MKPRKAGRKPKPGIPRRPLIRLSPELCEIKQGWTDVDIAKELGMDADEVLRFKQNTGLPELFENHSFSSSWE
jgi:hypothetical protein